MSQISFSAFANVLFRYLAEGMSQHAFARVLFEKITDYEERDEDTSPLDKSESTYKKYFSGDTSIQVLANAIRGHIDKSKFVSWLAGFNPEALEEIRKELADYLPLSETYNTPEACFELFASIISNPESAYDGKRAIAPNPPLPLQIDYSVESQELSLKEESANKCLVCGKRLKASTLIKIVPPQLDYQARAALRKAVGEKVGNLPVPDFESGFDYHGSENMAVVHLECRIDYEQSFSIERCANLMANKIKAKQRYKAQLAMDEIAIEGDLRNLLDSLDSLIDPADVEQLRYRPIKVKDKINPESHILKSEIDNLVNSYYGFIQSELRARDSEGEFDAESLGMSMRRCYKELQKIGENQDHIYDAMARWVSDSTGCENYSACRVLIAFFVQNCEVFDEIPQ